MYKQSKYNHIYPFEDKVYYVNALRGTSFPLKKEEHKKIKKLFADPITFELEYPTIFSQFFKWGFFVDTIIQEEMIVYSEFITDYVNDSNLHISVLVEKENSLSFDFICCLKSYIINTLNKYYITSLTLEWNGDNVLAFFDSFIFPLSKELVLNCRSKNVNFINYINVAIACNPLIHNKVFHEMGIPTYKKYLSIIEKIKLSPDFILNLKVFYKEEKDKKICKRKFVNEPTINLSFELINKNILNPHGIVFVRNESLYCPRKNMVIIKSDYRVFSSCMAYTDNTSVGHLNKDGYIEWEHLKREKDLTFPWFFNSECRKCKLLPLLTQICCNYQITENSIVCPVKNKVVSEKEFIFSIISNKKNEL